MSPVYDGYLVNFTSLRFDKHFITTTRRIPASFPAVDLQLVITATFYSQFTEKET